MCEKQVLVLLKVSVSPLSYKSYTELMHPSLHLLISLSLGFVAVQAVAHSLSSNFKMLIFMSVHSF